MKSDFQVSVIQIPPILSLFIDATCFQVPPGVILKDDATGRVLKDFNISGEKVNVVIYSGDLNNEHLNYIK